MIRWRSRLSLVFVLVLSAIAAAGLAEAGLGERHGDRRPTASCSRHPGGLDLTATRSGTLVGPAWRLVEAADGYDVWRTDRDVARTRISVHGSDGNHMIRFRVDRAYPSHFEVCRVRLFGGHQIDQIVPQPHNDDTTFASEIFANDGTLWVGFDVGSRDVVTVRVHIEQQATPDTSYEFAVSLCGSTPDAAEAGSGAPRCSASDPPGHG